MVVDRVAVGRAGDDDVRTAGRGDLGAGVVFVGGAGVDRGATVEVEVEVDVAVGDGAVEDVVVVVDVVERELLVAGVLEAVLVGAVGTDGEPPLPPAPHPATASNNTGTARYRRRTLGTVIDRCPRMWPQRLANKLPQLRFRNCGAGRWVPWNGAVPVPGLCDSQHLINCGMCSQ